MIDAKLEQYQIEREQIQQDLDLKAAIRDALQDMLKWTIIASACLSVAALGILIIVWSVLT